METHDRASLRRPPLFWFIILLVLDKKGAFLSSMGIILDEKRYMGGVIYQTCVK